MDCVDIEFPNKLGQTIGGPEDLQTPKELHPAFYGCFDWHSAVHGHWSLVRLLKQFSDLENKELIKLQLLESISKENILKEVSVFSLTMLFKYVKLNRPLILVSSHTSLTTVSLGFSPYSIPPAGIDHSPL